MQDIEKEIENILANFTIPPPKWIPQIDKPDSNRKARRFDKFRLKHPKRGFTKSFKSKRN